MKRLVIEWDSPGDYECPSFREVRCIWYESAEAFIVHFEELLMDRIVTWRQYREEHAEWLRKEPKMPRPGKHQAKLTAEWEQQYVKWHQARPIHDNIFHIAGLEFPFWVFCTWMENTHEYDNPTLPDVYELDEWFSLRAGMGNEQ